jgi:hypothetical protein
MVQDKMDLIKVYLKDLLELNKINSITKTKILKFYLE